MPFDRPSLTDLITRSQADVQSRLACPALLPVSNLAVLSRVHAGGVHGLYGFLDWLAQQVLADTAEAEWLARQAAIRGLARVAASYAAGDLTLTGTTGTEVLADTAWQRADGTLYRALAPVTLTGGGATVAIRAVVAGAAGTTAAGVTLTLVSPVAGLVPQALVASGGLSGGADEEGDEALRGRLLDVIRQPPQGGSRNDYVQWALAAHPEVTRAWCYPEEGGPGTVTVRMMSDGITADGIPSSVVVAAVEAYLQERRPVTAAVTVLAPVAAPLACALSIAPDTAAIRAAVVASLADLILSEAVPNQTLPISHIRAAISAAAGEVDYTLTEPAADVSVALGHIVTLGTVTWS